MNECKYPNKIRYPSEGKAIKALKHMPKHMSRSNLPYKCGDHWHIGRPIRRRKIGSSRTEAKR